MGAALDELERRQARRATAERSMAQMKSPTLMSDEAEKAYLDKRKELKGEIKETMLMLTPDMSRLLWAFKEVCRQSGKEPSEEYQKAVVAVPIASDIERAIHEREAREAEKAAKQNKEVPGQMKMEAPSKGGKGKVKDDGSTVEAAGECVSKPYTAENLAAGTKLETASKEEGKPEGTESDATDAEAGTSTTQNDQSESESTKVEESSDEQTTTAAAEDASSEETPQPGKPSTTEQPSSTDSLEEEGTAPQPEPTEGTLRLVPPSSKKTSKLSVKQ